jgi:hypothetical protein
MTALTRSMQKKKPPKRKGIKHLKPRDWMVWYLGAGERRVSFHVVTLQAYCASQAFQCIRALGGFNEGGWPASRPRFIPAQAIIAVQKAKT